MRSKKFLLFKLGNREICKAPIDISIMEVELIRKDLSKKLGCRICDIDVDYINEENELSLLCVNGNGELIFEDLPNHPVVGMRITKQVNDDENHISNFISRFFLEQINEYDYNLVVFTI